MRIFILTSTNYQGEAELHYNQQEVLCRIDVANTNMIPAQVNAFKCHVPLTVSQLESGMGIPTTVTIVEKDYEVSFELFWTAYNNKVNKARCIPVWNKLSKAQQVAAWFGVKKYEAYLQRTNWRNKADPEKYLKDRYWENEWK